MSEEKPKVRHQGLKRCRSVARAQSSSCQTISQMCNLKWPGLHVTLNRRSVCFANEWGPAHLHLLIYTLAVHMVDGNDSVIVLLVAESRRLESRNDHYSMIVICGFFFFFFFVETGPRYVRNAASAATAAATKRRKWRWRTPTKTELAELFFFLKHVTACLAIVQHNKNG